MSAPSSRHATSGTTTPADDRELLRRYVEEKSEPAFAELVQRHLDLVHSAALRRLGGDAHAAGDVSQQVFTAVARQAASLTRCPVLPGWLYTTTRNVAVDFIRAEQRRRSREQEVHTMHEQNSPPTSDAAWTHLRPLLDAAMDELGDRDREAVLLRFFARRPFAEIGTALNLSEDAARMRVDRAFEKLRARLSRHGITSTASALTAVLANQAAATAPVGMAASIAGAALSGAAAAGTGTMAAGIAFLAETKFIAGLGLAATLAISISAYQSERVRGAAASLAAGRADFAAMQARLSGLEAQTQAAEKELADRENASAKLAAASTAPKPLAAASAAASENARRQKALRQFLDNDPQLRRLRLEADRASFKANSAPGFLSASVTPEQFEQRAASYAQRKQQQYAESAVGLEPPSLAGPTWDGSQMVKKLAVNLYYADEPFTAQQAKRLTEIFTSAKTTADPGVSRAHFDWDRVLAEAERILSPAPLQGLRAQAALGRMDVQFAAAAREAAAAPKE